MDRDPNIMLMVATAIRDDQIRYARDRRLASSLARSGKHRRSSRRAPLWRLHLRHRTA
jgi:hypothetical protein